MSCIVATGNAQFSCQSNVLLDANIILPELQYCHSNVEPGHLEVILGQ